MGVGTGSECSLPPRNQHGAESLPPMLLTDVQVRNSRLSSKPRKLYDGDGLFLLVPAQGSHGWRFK